MAKHNSSNQKQWNLRRAADEKDNRRRKREKKGKQRAWDIRRDQKAKAAEVAEAERLAAEAAEKASRTNNPADIAYAAELKQKASSLKQALAALLTGAQVAQGGAGNVPIAHVEDAVLDGVFGSTLGVTSEVDPELVDLVVGSGQSPTASKIESDVLDLAASDNMPPVVPPLVPSERAPAVRAPAVPSERAPAVAAGSSPPPRRLPRIPAPSPSPPLEGEVLDPPPSPSRPEGRPPPPPPIDGEVVPPPPPPPPPPPLGLSASDSRGPLTVMCLNCVDFIAPARVKCVVTGVVDNLCTGCSAFNGTFYLDRDTRLNAPSCSYRIASAVTGPYKIFPCGSKALDLWVWFEVSQLGFGFRVQVSFGYWPDDTPGWVMNDSGCGSYQAAVLHCMQTFTCTSTPTGGTCVGSQSCTVSPAV